MATAMATRSFVGDRSQLAAMTTKPSTKKVTSAALPALNLSLEDQNALRVLAEDLEREVVDVYEEFLFDHHRQVDSLRWKQIRSQEDLRVYCERDVNMRSINRLQPFFPSGQSVKRELGPQATLAAQSRVPLKLVSGTVVGTLDDAMYGGTVHDTASIRMRCEYQREVMQDNSVLQVIEEATDEDPYQFMGIVWYLKSMGLPGIISDRDMLLLSRIHFSEMSNGERIGVHLYHSIQLPMLPPFSEQGVLRMNVSLVIIFRQLDERSVDVFMLDVLDAKGSTPTILNVQESAKTLLASGNICSTGVNKKLYWCMRERQRKHRAVSGGMFIELDEAMSKHCCVCAKNMRRLFGSSGSLCHLCRQRSCSKCAITRQIIISDDDNTIESKSFNFCRLCLMDVKNRSTFDIARAEMYERRLVREHRALSDRPVSESLTSSSTSGAGTRAGFVSLL